MTASLNSPQEQSPACEGDYLLLIDCCGLSGSVALASLSSCSVVAAQELPGRSASERLLPAIRLLVEGQGSGLGSLAAVAVVHGPGSFTGVRVGLSAAKGFCEALAIPLIAISRLAVLASLAPEPLAHPTVVPLLDAGRGEFYSGVYRKGECREELLRSAHAVVTLFDSEPAAVLVACEAGVGNAFSEQRAILLPELLAADALAVALDRLRAGTLDDVAVVDANYVRRTDAEIFAKPAVKSARS